MPAIVRQGKAAPEFLFGTMYRLRNWTHGGFEACPVTEGFLDASLDPAAPFAM